MDRDDVIALVRAIGGPDRADPVCPQGDMITLDVDEVVRLVNIAAAQQAEQATQLNQSLGLYEQASEPVALSWDVQMPDDVAKWITAHPPKLHPARPAVPLYAADPIREAVLAEREACLSACNKIATESKNYHAQGGAQACWYALKARVGEA